MSDYPEHDKLSEVEDEVVAIIDFVNSGEVSVIHFTRHRDVERAVHAHYGIDPVKLEQERNAMIQRITDHMRSL